MFTKNSRLLYYDFSISPLLIYDGIFLYLFLSITLDIKTYICRLFLLKHFCYIISNTGILEHFTVFQYFMFIIYVNFKYFKYHKAQI